MKRVLIISTNRCDAGLIEYLARPAHITHIDGQQPIESLREATRAGHFDVALLHFPKEIDKAVELKTYLQVIRYHARIRIMPTTFGGRALLSPAWMHVVRQAVRPRKPSRKKEVAQ